MYNHRIEHLMKIILENPASIEYLNLDPKNDVELYIVAIQKNGLVLKHVPEILKDQEIIARIAIRQNPLSLKFSSNSIRNNEKIVLEAIEKDIAAFKYASLRLINEVNGNDPISYLRHKLLEEKLDKVIPVSSNLDQKNKKKL